MHKYYVCRYYINAEHSVDNIQKNAHQHTFTLGLSVEALARTGMVPFFEIDRLVNSYVLQYNGAYLNAMPQFQGRYPSLEWMGEVIYQDVHALLDEDGAACSLSLRKIPSRFFSYRTGSCSLRSTRGTAGSAGKTFWRSATVISKYWIRSGRAENETTPAIDFSCCHTDRSDFRLGAVLAGLRGRCQYFSGRSLA